MSMAELVLAWLTDPAHWTGPNGIPVRLGQHVVLSLLAVAAAAALAVPAGLIIGHTGRGAGLVGAVTGAARSVPTLALVTLFGLALGIGLEAPFLTLVILAIPSCLAGAYAGVRAVSRVTVDAARAIGMSPAQVLLRVELPLASPVLIGGVRAATLQVIATATLAAYISDTGLGRYLFSGLKSRDFPQMLGGAILVAALALAVELAFALIQRAVTASAARNAVHPGTVPAHLNPTALVPARTDPTRREASS
jgi:osmoprotectant transport system permease protein